ncbi:MAG: DUF3152 domain-containing protein [Nitriliruptorales bacterium]|nr:DUF3152 domain-containing protein [Nitriliruptorales bacterium]
MGVMRGRRGTAMIAAAAAAMTALSVWSATAAAAVEQAQSRRAGHTSFLEVRGDTPPWHRVVTYVLRADDTAAAELGAFADVADQTLNDPRGWGSGGAIDFVRVRHGGEFRLWLASRRTVAAAHVSCSPEYSCRVGKDVLINAARWRDGAATFRGHPLDDYRQYVINHEVGHWLGLKHQECPGKGGPAPVMQQQTIRLDGCEPRVWPLHREIRVARPALQAG